MAVDRDLAKQQCRVTHDREDGLIDIYLKAAQSWVENYTGKLLERREVAQPETNFGAFITLNYGPAPENVEITYSDSGEDQTITNTRIVRDRIYPLASWPGVVTPAMIAVSYTAGYDETPGDLDAAVLLLVADMYMNREAGAATPATTAAVQALCSPYRSVFV